MLGRFTVIMDDDLQHRPSDIHCFMKRSAGDMTSCYADFFKKKQTLLKNLYSWVAGKVAEAVLRSLGRYTCRRSRSFAATWLTSLKVPGPFPYIDGLLFQITDNISQITVEHQKRHSGGTTHNFWKQSQVFLNLATNFLSASAPTDDVSGVLCSGIGFLLGIYFLLVYLLKGIKVYGWTALMLVNLFFGGAMLISLGMLGEYLARVLMNVNQIPNSL